MIVLIIFIIISIFIIYRLFFTQWSPSLIKQLIEKDFFYYGHRGAPSIAYENTLQSFSVAINHDMDGLELDVQLTKDGHFIVYHDQYINYNNSNCEIHSLNLSEIQSIELNQKKRQSESIKIPLLNEVLKIVPKNIILNNEIKSYRWRISNDLEHKLIQLIRKSFIEKQIIISSFNPRIIKIIKRLNPDIPTALIWSSQSSLNYKIFCYYSKPDAFHVNINDVNKQMVNWFNKKNMRMYAYTINSSEDLRTVQQYNLDGVFTDNPKIKNV